MLYGDTGWRIITLENGWTHGQCLIRRANWTVYLVLVDLDADAATSQTVYTLPTGFGATGSVRGVVNSNPAIPAYRIVSNDSTVFIPEYAELNGALVSASMTWGTVESWPTSLPGTPSGVIPTGFVDETVGLLPTEDPS
jgi:hypothetical protein